MFSSEKIILLSFFVTYNYSNLPARLRINWLYSLAERLSPFPARDKINDCFPGKRHDIDLLFR